MAPKEPTRQQLSSRLAYNQTTPAFLQRLKNKVAGVSDDDDYGDEEFDDWQAASGRPPIPRRPPSPPQRPDDDPGSADEDGADEKPQVVVLKEGKHMTAREAENEKRRARGLPPLPEGSTECEDDSMDSAGKNTKDKLKADGKDAGLKSAPLSFSSSSACSSVTSTAKKRKTIGDGLDKLADGNILKKGKTTSKVKKAKMGALLSFGDGNDG